MDRDVNRRNPHKKTVGRNDPPLEDRVKPCPRDDLALADAAEATINQKKFGLPRGLTLHEIFLRLR